MTTLTAPRPAPANVAPNPAETPFTLADLGDPAFAFVVHGVPAPQGSKKSVGTFKEGHKRAGQAILAESSKKVAPWRREVAKVAQRLVDAYPDLGWEPLSGPLVADMVFTLARPKSFPKSDRTNRREHGRPSVYPDASKLIRSTEDALSGIVWNDDAQVVAYRRAEKFYVGDLDPDALREPGAVIRVWNLPVGGLL